MSRYGGWSPYVSVGERRARARKKMDKLRKKGMDIKPVEIEGRKIARTFWGEAWCDHLESFSDYENRLPRGRTYVRNGSVCHLDIAKGEVNAMVSGSEIYKVEISIKTLPRTKWKEVKKSCAGQIGSLLELLQGRVSDSVMKVVTDRNKGLFPLPGEIKLNCSCPDWAVMCKHVAAVLYGVGARLDQEPELLFLLRGANHAELISAEVDVSAASAGRKGGRKRIADDALIDVFGIEMSEDVTPVKTKSLSSRKKTVSKSKKVSEKVSEKVLKKVLKKNSKVIAKSKVKSKVKSSKSKTVVTKISKSKKAKLKVSKQPDRTASSVTGKAVTGLRVKFGMSQSQFARLLGVSASTIGNWAKEPGKLDLKASSLRAWNMVKKLTKQQAWQSLDKL